MTLALLHTAPVLIPVFADLAARLLENVRVFHLADESLLKNTISTGHLEKITIRRVCAHIESAHQAGADAVLVTCSSIGAAIPVARQLFDFPILRWTNAWLKPPSAPRTASAFSPRFPPRSIPPLP